VTPGVAASLAAFLSVDLTEQYSYIEMRKINQLNMNAANYS